MVNVWMFLFGENYGDIRPVPFPSPFQLSEEHRHIVPSGYQGARKWRLKLLILGIWSSSCLVSLAPLVGCNRYTYEGYLISSTVDYLSQQPAHIAFNWMLFSIAWVGPSIMILVSHVKILKANR